MSLKNTLLEQMLVDDLSSPFLSIPEECQTFIRRH
jgi:hypothetical protein